MFSKEVNSIDAAKKIVRELSGLGHNLGHDKHISIKDAIEIGLKISPLENDQDLQDAVLTVHHCFMHTFSQAPNLIKAIENHYGVGTFNFGPIEKSK